MGNRGKTRKGDYVGPVSTGRLNVIQADLTPMDKFALAGLGVCRQSKLHHSERESL